MHYIKPTAKGLSLWMILFFMSLCLQAQDLCLNPDKIEKISNTNTLIKAVGGYFNGDHLYDLLTYELEFKNIKEHFGSANGLIFSKDLNIDGVYSITATKDIHGDGYDDVFISKGDSIYVYKGSPSGLTLDNERSIDLADYINDTGEPIKGFITVYRDFNNDGMPDFILTASTQDPNTGAFSTRTILQGTSDGFTVAKTEIIPNSLYSKPLSNIGDLNGDGFEDYIFSNTIFYANESHLDNSRTQLVDVDFFRTSPVKVNDVNGDGFDDVLYSSYQLWSEGYDEAGYLFLGSPTGLSENYIWYASDTSSVYEIGDGFGQAASWAGDINGDGLSDFIIAGGEQNYTRIYYGNTDPTKIKAEQKIGIEMQFILPTGDINGDGKNDWIATYYERLKPGTNLVTFYGNGNGLSMGMACLVSPDSPDVSLNAIYARSAGDINKDGFEDLLVGHDNLDYTTYDELGQITVYSTSSSGIAKEEMAFQFFQSYFGSQLGSGDYNGDGYSDVFAGHYGTGSIFIFNGSASGMDRIADYVIKDYDGGLNGWGEHVTEGGDINGDGYDDIIANGINGLTILYGSVNGPVRGPVSNITGYGYKAGDVNKDGYDDFIVQTPTNTKLYYGSANQPVNSGYEFGLGATYIGDVNGDGYPDIMVSDRSTNISSLLIGNGVTFIPNGQQFPYSFNPAGIGDFNGDGFDDLAFSSNIDTAYFYGAPTRVDLYLGSVSGLQSNIFKTFRSEIKYQNLIPQPRIGDINNDGKDDLFVSAKYYGFIYYGEGGGQDITCPKDTVLYLDTTCKALAPMLNPPGEPSLFNYTISGATTLNGSGAITGIYLNRGLNLVTYSLKSDPSQTCNFSVRVLDTLKPVINVFNPLVLCDNNSMIPSLKINNECEVKDVMYELTGATKGTGTGISITQKLNRGITNIRWTVTDSSGNTSTASTKVHLQEKLDIRIYNAYQVNASQSAANTIYTGYANNTIRVSAYHPTSTNFKYRWSNGDTTRYSRIKQSIPGRYTYSVIVTNEYGCSDTAYTTITVVDNYCPNPLKDFITQYFPQYLNDPFVQSLLMATSQSYVCVNGNTQCVPTGSLKNYITSGAKLGKCGTIPNTANLKTAQELTISEVLNITASPNPSSYEFNLKISGNKGKPYSLRIYNNTGALVMQKHNLTQELIRTGSTLQKGIYIAEVIQGIQRKSIRLLKIK